VDYIARDRPLATADWYDGLVRRIELLRDMPQQGRVVPEWYEESVREILWEPYRVIYEVFEDRVEILTLSHSRQQLLEGP
jgi:plasmid stabilization system protein ParE